MENYFCKSIKTIVDTVSEKEREAIIMKKNVGSVLALYPTPLVVVGAMTDGKPKKKRKFRYSLSSIYERCTRGRT